MLVDRFKWESRSGFCRHSRINHLDNTLKVTRPCGLSDRRRNQSKHRSHTTRVDGGRSDTDSASFIADMPDTYHMVKYLTSSNSASIRVIPEAREDIYPDRIDALENSGKRVTLFSTGKIHSSLNNTGNLVQIYMKDLSSSSHSEIIHKNTNSQDILTFNFKKQKFSNLNQLVDIILK